MIRLVATLLLLFSATSSSEAFVRENGKLLSLVRTETQCQSQFQKPHESLSPASNTALLQSTIAPRAEPDGLSVLRRLRTSLLNIRGGGGIGIGKLLEKHPFSAAVMITTVNALAADLMTQLVFESNPWNPKRSFLFATFGFLYQGIAQYAIVNWGWERLFPGTKPKAVIAKICGMNLLSDPRLFMPTFYIFKEFMAQGSLSFAMIKAALLSYKANALLDWRNSWMVWFPGHAVTYGVMPSHQRIPWMAFLSFFYMCVLSLTRGGA